MFKDFSSDVLYLNDEDSSLDTCSDYIYTSDDAEYMMLVLMFWLSNHKNRDVWLFWQCNSKPGCLPVFYNSVFKPVIEQSRPWIYQPPMQLINFYIIKFVIANRTMKPYRITGSYNLPSIRLWYSIQFHSCNCSAVGHSAYKIFGLLHITS